MNLGGRYVQFSERADLEQGAEGDAADRAVVGLVAEAVGAHLAQAQVAAR